MRISKEVNDIIIKAYEEARNNNDEYLTAEHLLYAALGNENVIEIINKCGGDIEGLRSDLKEYIEKYVNKVEGRGPQESFNFQQVILMASEHVINCGKKLLILIIL